MDQNQNVTVQTVEVEFTSIRYKNEVTRGNYSTINEEDISFFESLLGLGHVCRDVQKLEKHNMDYYCLTRGQSQLLLSPRNAEEVGSILRYCNERRLAICPQGGNTGLVFGSIPVYDEIILSTSAMNQIISMDELTGVLVCESGCTLDSLIRHAGSHGFLFPLDLAPKDKCQIGGNVSTNAGGLRLFRYGSLHSTVLGLEVVLANGEILDSLTTVKKDNTGYDLKHLFIGSEGTLGIITKVAIQCPPKPRSTGVMLLGLTSMESVLETFKDARIHFMESLSCCEYIDSEAMACVQENMGLKSPIGEWAFNILIECSGRDDTKIQGRMNLFLEKCMEAGIVGAGTVSANPDMVSEIWNLRRSIGDALPIDGYTYKYDFSIPLQKFSELVETVKARIGSIPYKRCCGFGHMGDNNLHLTITARQYDPELTSVLEPFVYEWVGKEKGSISAEHGLGFKERKYITYSKSTLATQMMKKIKDLFDPNAILNPYKVLPPE